MKKSRQVVERRRDKVLGMVQKTGDIKVEEMAEYLHVSKMTIRRDLQYLEDEKMLERYYGGARSGGVEEDCKDEKEMARKQIAKYAAGLVEDGDTIFINTSKTALGILPYITAKHVTVITNNGNAIGMKHSSDITVALTGGELRYIKGSMVGDIAVNSLTRVTANKSFIGCSGLSIESGMTTEYLNEVQINEMMFSRVTERAFILADSSKLSIKSSFVSRDVNNITDIITDENAPEEIVAAFREKGVTVKLVSLHENNNKETNYGK